MSKTEERLSLLSEIASMYYVRNMSQEEIAEKMFLSRSRISRLLKQANESGVVEIRIKYFSERNSYLEKLFREKYQLKDIQIYNCNNCTDQEVHDVICRYSAMYVQEILQKNSIVGITRGSIIAGMIGFLNKPRQLNLTVIQVMGAEARESIKTTAGDLIREIINRFGGTAVYIDAPLYVENDLVRKELLKEPMLARELRIANSAQHVITSVRHLYKNMENHVWSGFIDDGVLNEIVDAGGVGYMFGRAFTIEGKLVNHPVNHRIIAIDMEGAKRKTVTAIAYGKNHGEAVLGALRGQFISQLIIDQACAQRVLELDRSLSIAENE